MPIQITLEKLENNQWTPETITLNVEEDFAIDDQALDKDMCQIGRLLSRYGDLWGEMEAQRSRKAQDLKAEFASQSLQIRSTGKFSENHITAKVHDSAQYKAKFHAFNNTERDALKIEKFYRGLVKKADIMLALAYKQRAEIQKMGGAF